MPRLKCAQTVSQERKGPGREDKGKRGVCLAFSLVACPFSIAEQFCSSNGEPRREMTSEEAPAKTADETQRGKGKREQGDGRGKHTSSRVKLFMSKKASRQQKTKSCTECEYNIQKE